MALASALAFGTLAVSGKVAFEAGAAVSTFVAVRFIGGSALLWLVCLATRRRLLTYGWRQPLRLFALGAAVLAPEVAFFFLGVSTPGITAGMAEVIFFAYPVWTLLFTWRDSRRHHLLAAAVALAGVGLTAGALEAGTWEGVVALLVASLLYAGYVVGSSRGLREPADPLVSTAWMLSGAAASLSVLWALDRGELPSGNGGAAAVVSSVLVGTVLAYLLLYSALRTVPPATAAILTMAEPLTAIGLGFVLLGDRVSTQQVVGTSLILGAIAYLLRKEQRDSGPIS